MNDVLEFGRWDNETLERIGKAAIQPAIRRFPGLDMDINLYDTTVGADLLYLAIGREVFNELVKMIKE